MNPTPRFRLLAVFVISLCAYGMLAYGLNRANAALLISLFAVLFLCYYYSVQQVDSSQKLRAAVGAAILFRIVLIAALPNLSDDVYRFIWDGNLLVNGFNPFAHPPAFYMENGLPEFLSRELYSNLNSQQYFTIYPPVSQYIYALSAALCDIKLGGNVLVMKGFIVAAEMGTLWILKKLIEHFRRSPGWLLLYALNPLIIVELSGNMHFEGVMIFFLLAAYYCWLKEKRWPAAILFVLAVNTKLIPLIMMPYLVFSLGWKRSAGLIGVTVGGTLLLHLPFLDAVFLHNFGDSLGLYFQSFEFNASIYYLVRWVGFQIKGYNIIRTAAPILALISTLGIFAVAWYARQKTLRNLPRVIIVSLSIYYLFSTTIHPWYLCTLVAFVPLSRLVFPVVWSVVIPLSYTAYATTGYEENLWLIALEYAIVLAAIGYEYRHRLKTHFMQSSW